MTVSMLTTRLSSVITGCGGNETTCSRRSISGRTPVDERDDEREPRRQRAVVAAEPLHDPACACGTIRTVRREGEQRRTATTASATMQSDHAELLYSYTSAVAPSIFVDLDLRARLDHLVGHERARATTPRRRCDAPAVIVDALKHDARAPLRAPPCRCGSRPACAGAFGRSAAAPRATRPRPTANTISCSHDGGAECRGDGGDARGERDRAEEEEAGREDLAYREQDSRNDPHEPAPRLRS